jgi:miniconductance mechanosensitive channel
MESATLVAALTGVIVIVLVAGIADRIVSGIIGWLVPKIVARFGSETPRKWELALGKQRVAKRSAHIVAAVILYRLIPVVLNAYPSAVDVIQDLLEGYLVIVAVLAINAVLRATKDVWDESDLRIGVPVRFATQALEVVVWCVGTILVISVVFDKSVTVLLSGLAGMTAILALVFRDTILGFVAGIQFSGNDMLKTGDWIEVPQYGANGTVEEIFLTTVKIRNFDKTISTVPTHAISSESFKNWRGMWDFEARRIKRSMNVDMNEVRFLTEEDVARLKANHQLQDFWSAWEATTESKPRSLTGLTNLSLFRDYLAYYLKQNPDICSDKLMMVRQLEPSPQGLPIEIYCFCADIKWTHFENVQWEIIDHALAVIPSFGLKVFQLTTSLQSA